MIWIINLKGTHFAIFLSSIDWKLSFGHQNRGKQNISNWFRQILIPTNTSCISFFKLSLLFYTTVENKINLWIFRFLSYTLILERLVMVGLILSFLWYWFYYRFDWFNGLFVRLGDTSVRGCYRFSDWSSNTI